MTNNEIVHLHNHTDFSMLDGLAKTQAYLDEAKKLGMKGLGTADHGNVHGALDLINAAHKLDMTPVPGCELYMAPINEKGAKTKEQVFYGKTDKNGKTLEEFDVSGDGAYTHCSVWAINNTGLKNLFKLSSMSFQPENSYRKPRIDFDMLANHSEGLVVATGCPSSEISTRFLLGQDNIAYNYAQRLLEVFGRDRLFVEIMNHGMKNDLERTLIPKQLELSKKMNLGLLATNDCHYVHSHDAPHHEEFLCAQSAAFMSHAPMSQGGKRFAFDGTQFYLKSADEMATLFPHEQFPNAMKNTLLIAEMAKDIHVSYDPTLRPEPTIPQGYNKVSYFKHLINKGFEFRYGNSPKETKREAKRRIQNEFDVIYSSDFIGYFLLVHEYLNYAKITYSTRNAANEIVAMSIGAGRGSVGGSIIAFILEISEICPIRHDLLFERFLSAGRGATYRITYEDGTTEDILVSEQKNVIQGTQLENKYIHELKIGDIICVDKD